MVISPVVVVALWLPWGGRSGLGSSGSSGNSGQEANEHNDAGSDDGRLVGHHGVFNTQYILFYRVLSCLSIVWLRVCGVLVFVVGAAG